MADALLRFTGPNPLTPSKSLEIPVSAANPLPCVLVGLTVFAAPTTGGTVVMAATTGREVLTPAGTLAALTVTLPPNPGNGQIAGVSSSQIITSLTVNTSDGSSVNGAPSSMAANSAFNMAYQSSNTTWYLAP